MKAKLETITLGALAVLLFWLYLYATPASGWMRPRHHHHHSGHDRGVVAWAAKAKR